MTAWIPLLINIGVAILGAAQGADWIHLVGSANAGTAVAIVTGLNALAHAYANKGPAAK